MFPYIFGKSKETTRMNPPPVSKGPSHSTLMTVKMLADRESDLDKRITALTKQVDCLSSEALENYKHGEKTKALISMKKKSLLEDQIKTNTAMMMKLIEQKCTLENTIINSDTLAAMNHAANAMQAEQAIWSIDKIKDLQEKTDEVYSTHREINELLLEPIISGPTEEDLLEELNAMASAVTIEKVELPILPEVPTTVICSPTAACIEKSDEAILKELAGLIAS
jgi:hypothetical protein